jgi:thiol-disulfide isomerase/thioredoxin
MKLPALLLLAAALALQPMDEAHYRPMVESHRGQVLLVDFWATWCAPCRAEMPGLVALERKFRSQGLAFVTVSADLPEQRKEASAFLAKIGVAPPAYIKHTEDDEAFINTVSPKWSGALPALFLYDRHGRLARTFIGETQAETLEQEISKLLK